MAQTDIVLPNVGFGMEEGKLIAWLKAPGDAIRKGEPVAEVEGDKTNVELEALADGVLAEILVPAGTTVPVGTVLGRIGSSVTSSAAQPAAVAAPVAQAEASSGEKVQASPVARRLAQEQGIDLTGITGSGPGGRITREDVEAAAAQRVSTNGTSNGKVLAAPAVRKLARDHGVDLSAIHGTGAGGRITRA